ncbi:MAG: radical SAM protein [Candidatus Aenigmatarchaeota archaeon]
MKTCLVNVPYKYDASMETIPQMEPIKRESVNRGPPMGLMYVSTILKNKGYKCRIIDANVNDYSKEDLIDLLKEENPDLIGFSLIPFTMAESLKWMKYIKRYIDAKIIVGGYSMIYYAKELLSNDFIDYGIVGSAKDSLVKLIKHLEGDGLVELEEIEGLVYKENGEVKQNETVNCYVNLRDAPWPDRSGIENSNYEYAKKSPFTIIMSSHGCGSHCDFCDIGNFLYSERDPTDVVDEIEDCVKSHGIKHFAFMDDEFLLNEKRVENICDQIIDRDLDVSWWCMTSINNSNRRILKKMKEAGCWLVWYGIEAASQEVLDGVHKGTTLEAIKKTINYTKTMGIKAGGFFIIGYPNETPEKIKKRVEFSKKLPLDYAQFFRMTGKPGSTLYDKIVESMGYDYFKKIAKSEIEPQELPLPWTNMSVNDIEKWVMKAYKKFYMRPSYILQRIVDIRSLSDIKNLIFSGIEMINMERTDN